MAGPTYVRVHGLNKVLRNLRELQVDVNDMKAAFTRIGNLVLDDAQKRAPYRTGALKASMRVSKARNRAAIRAGSARVRYAPYQEFGTENNREVAFMRGAVESKRKRVVYELNKELKVLTRKANT